MNCKNVKKLFLSGILLAFPTHCYITSNEMMIMAIFKENKCLKDFIFRFCFHLAGKFGFCSWNQNLGMVSVNNNIKLFATADRALNRGAQ